MLKNDKNYKDLSMNVFSVFQVDKCDIKKKPNKDDYHKMLICKLNFPCI